MDYRIFESVELDIHANSVAVADLDAFIRVQFRRNILAALDPDESDLSVKARVVDEAGAIVVAAFDLTVTPGTELVGWHGNLAVPQSATAGNYVLQVYLAEDLDLTEAQQRQLRMQDLDADDLAPICHAFEYLA